MLCGVAARDIETHKAKVLNMKLKKIIAVTTSVAVASQVLAQAILELAKVLKELLILLNN